MARPFGSRSTRSAAPRRTDPPGRSARRSFVRREASRPHPTMLRSRPCRKSTRRGSRKSTSISTCPISRIRRRIELQRDGVMQRNATGGKRPKGTRSPPNERRCRGACCFGTGRSQPESVNATAEQKKSGQPPHERCLFVRAHLTRSAVSAKPGTELASSCFMPSYVPSPDSALFCSDGVHAVLEKLPFVTERSGSGLARETQRRETC